VNLDPVGDEMLHELEQRLDPYTIGHQMAVARLSVAMGRQLGLDVDALLALQLGAAIHDVGKGVIPLEVLHKQGRLTDEDWALIRRHPDVGAALAEELDCASTVVSIVRQHHERLDGSGYPDRLRGEQILLESRIVAVADTFEAAGFTRPYRVGMGSVRALEIVDSGRGSLFDPDVVASLHAVLAGGFTLDEHAPATPGP